VTADPLGSKLAQRYLSQAKLQPAAAGRRGGRGAWCTPGRVQGPVVSVPSAEATGINGEKEGDGHACADQ